MDYSGLLAEGQTGWVSSDADDRAIQVFMPLLFATLLGYITILSILATTSPGNGPLGWVLLFLPSHILDSLHAPAYGLLAWLGITGLRRRGWPPLLALTTGCLFSLVFGLWTETLQVSVPGRGFETKDLVTDGLGIALAGMMMSRQLNPVRTASLRGPEHSPSMTT